MFLNVIEPLYYNKEFIKEFVQDLYNQFLQKFKNSPILLISYSLFLILEFENVLNAYKFFSLASKRGCNLAQQFQIFVAKRVLIESIKNKNQRRNHIIPGSAEYKIYDRNSTVIIDEKQIPDYEKMIVYENEMREFSQKIFKYASDQIQFWECFIGTDIG